MISRISTFTFYLFILSAIFSCKKLNKNDEIPFTSSPDMGKYIMSYSDKYISVADDIVISFSSVVANPDQIGKVEEDLVWTDPAVKGKAYWKNASTLVFDPEENLGYGKKYQFHINLKSLFKDITDEYQEVFLEYETEPIHFKIEHLDLAYSNEIQNQSLQILGTVSYAKYFDAESVSKMFEVIQKQNKDLKIVWEKIGEDRSSFVITNIVRTDEDNHPVVIKWSGGKYSDEFNGERTIEILPKSQFSLIDIKSFNDGTKRIEASFSDLLRKNQNLKGLISIKDYTGDIKTDIRSNVLLIYPSGDLAKDFELTIDKQLKNTDGKALKENLVHTLSFAPTKPEVKSLRNGVIIPDADRVLIPFEAKNLNSVDVVIKKVFQNNVLQFLQYNDISNNYDLEPVGREVHQQTIDLASLSSEDNSNQWVRYAIDLKSMIGNDMGSIYKVVISFKKAYVNNYPCPDDKKNDDGNQDGSYGEGEEGDDYYYYGDYNNVNPCENYYYNNNNFINQTVLSSNIAVIAKMSEANEINAVCTDLLSIKPLPGAEVEIYDFQKQLLFKGYANGDGMFKAGPFKIQPSFIIVKKDKQYAYLKLQENESNSLSEFDVSGNVKKDGIDGFIYGERGIWRPGDTMHLCFVLEDKNSSLPLDHPVTMVITDARGKKYYEKTLTAHTKRIYYFPVSTNEADPTGNWKSQVTVGNNVFTKTLKVETIKPNRLKIQYQDLGKKYFDISTKKKDISFTSKWLHGASASGLKSEVEAKISSTPTSFTNYKEFAFDDPARKIDALPYMVFDGLLDENGQASYSLEKGKEMNPPGMINIQLKTRVYEKSGNFSEDYFSIKASPYNSYVGIKIPQSRWGGNFIKSGKEANIPIVLLDSDGNPISSHKLEVGMYNAEWNWWYYRSQDNLYKYNSTQHIGAIEKFSITTNAKGQASWQPTFEDYGNYMVRVCDTESGHCTGAFFYTGYYGNPPSSEDSPKLLTIKSDKNEYRLGEEIKLTLPSSYASKILISIEGAKEVAKTFWVDGKEGDIQINIPTKEDMTPNIYIHATLVQPYNNSGNDLPLRLYGVLPVKIVDPRTTLHPIVSMPKSIEPDSKCKITVSEKEGKEMAYTLAVVDDGLLDISRFQTPDPWNYFYSKQALGIRTWDVYDDVASPFGDRVEATISIGGDGQINNAASAKKANRFKPVVKYFGPFKLAAGQKAQHELLIQNYVGSVRAMVVAVNDMSYGNAETTSVVKKPVMVQTTLPRVLGPDEQVTLSANVFAMDDNIGSITTSVKSNELIHIQGNNSMQLQLPKISDDVNNFNLKVGENTGIAKLIVTSNSSKYQAKEDIEIDIRNPNPYESKSQEKTINANQNADIEFDLFGVNGTNEATIELSSIPPFNLEKRLKYLIRYPYGCIEQTTSSVFPQLYLSDISDMTTKDKARVDEAIKRGIQRLALFQLNSGGFSYWPGENEINEWGSDYAGHFLIEAKEKGYYVPNDMLSKYLSYQKRMASNFQASNFHYYSREDYMLVQAYRLYTLAKAGVPELGAMNKLRGMNDLDNRTAHLLAASYALIGKKDIAEELIRKRDTKIKVYRDLGYTFGSNIRDMAIMSEVYSLLGKVSEEKSMVEAISNYLNSDSWYGTHSTSFGLLAIGKFCKKLDKSGIKANYLFNGKSYEFNTNKSVAKASLILENGKTTQKVTIKNLGKSYLFAKVIYSGQRKVGTESHPSNQHIKMDVAYFNMDGKPIDITSLVQGTNFYSKVTITNLGTKAPHLPQMALTQVMPSGWEIQNERITGMVVKEDSPKEYEDIRDDRVNTFFSLYSNSPVSYTTMLTATYAGKFYLPAVTCGAMYDIDVYSATNGKWVTVTPSSANKEKL